MNVGISWRETARTPTLGPVDARAFAPMLFQPLGFLSSTLWMVNFATICVFGVLSWFGLTIPVLWRKSRHLLLGRERSTRPWWYWRRVRVRNENIYE